MPRVAICGLWHETNTFAVPPTTREHFHVLEGAQIPAALGGTRTPIGGFLDRAAHEGLNIVPTVFAWALPSGTVDAATHDDLAARLVDRTAAARPDAVLMDLHGAMVAEGHEDVEGDLVRLVRRALPQVPVGVVLDFHANTTATFVGAVDVLAGYDSYPHLDPYDRGVEVAGLMVHVLGHDLQPVHALVQPPLLIPPQAQATDQPPLHEIMARAHAAERQPGVVNITVAAGFPYADIPSAGTSVVVTSQSDAVLAQGLADELARMLWDARSQFHVSQVTPDEAVARALRQPEGPVILVDSADNIGGGAPGDGTAVLAALLRGRAAGAVVEVVDPEVVALARRTGEGGVLTAEVGGKTDRLHGPPVGVRGRVERLCRSEFTYTGSYMTGRRVDGGWTALLDVDGVRLVIRERKVMPFDQEELRVLGLEPGRCRIIVVKSAVAWRAAYGTMARAVIEVDTPGVCTADLRTIRYRRVRRPVVPLDEEVAW